MEQKTFYSNGKLLLTGEYVVLDGALAFAVPTKFGQILSVSEGNNHEIFWKSFDNDASVWFEGVFTFESIKNKQTTNENSKVANTLIEILHQAFLQNPKFIEDSSGYIIETKLTFPRNWGLGTSSTLINNLGQWLAIDPFELLFKSFGGSGYDVACAQKNDPILYSLIKEKPVFESVIFNPEFKDNIYFVYLNQKQNSKSAINNYLSKRHKVSKVIHKINAITHDALQSINTRDFALLMEQHEIILSDVLEAETIKERLFPDFKGVVKSLGAWGGDFVMIISEENPISYFKDKGFETILTYNEMVL